MLKGDTSAGDDLQAVMEQPIPVPPMFQSDDTTVDWDNVPPGSIIDVINAEWALKIREACKEKQDQDDTYFEDPERVNRMAAYMCQVNTAKFTAFPEADRMRTQLFEMLLTEEKFFNINPLNPPRFKGAAFDYIRMKPDEVVRHQERRVPVAALTQAIKQMQEWLAAGVVKKQTPRIALPCCW
jgi:hypothetical protein